MSDFSLLFYFDKFFIYTKYYYDLFFYSFNDRLVPLNSSCNNYFSLLQS